MPTENIEKRKLPSNAYDLMLSGGKWLAEIRSQIQTRFVNGDNVTWGSNEILKGSLAVKDLEDMAACVAFETIQEYAKPLLASHKELVENCKKYIEEIRKAVERGNDVDWDNYHIANDSFTIFVSHAEAVLNQDTNPNKANP